MHETHCEKRFSSKKSYSYIIQAIMSLCAGLSLFMTYRPSENTYELSNLFARGLRNIRISLQGEFFQITIVVLAFFLISRKIAEFRFPKSRAMFSFKVLVSFIWLLSVNYSIDNSLNYLIYPEGQMFKSIVFFVGSYWVISNLVRVIHIYLNYRGSDRLENRENRYIKIFLLLLAVWSVPLVSSYPANNCNDSWTQLNQFWGYLPFTSHHPPMHTIILGLFTKFGRLIGDADIGLFLFVIGQTIIYGVVVSYAIWLMDEMKADKFLKYVYIIISLISPYYVNYVNLTLKDCLYSIFFYLWIIELLYFSLVSNRRKIFEMRHVVIYIISAVCSYLLRNNGKYVVCMASIIILFYLLVNYCTSSDRTVRRNIILMMILPIIFAEIISLSAVKIYNIKAGSRAEILSVPFQQTARYVRDYPEDVTKEEKEAISNILEYEELAEKYNPLIADPVKGLYNNQATGHELKEYFFAWVRMFGKHPWVYVEATINQNYGLLYPFVENKTVYISYSSTHEEAMHPISEDVGFHEVKRFDDIREIEFEWSQLMFSFPLIGIASHPAVYILLFLVLFICSILRKEYKFVVFSSPLLLSLGVIVLAPVFNGHPRYAFPIIYTVPLYTAYYKFLTIER